LKKLAVNRVVKLYTLLARKVNKANVYVCGISWILVQSPVAIFCTTFLEITQSNINIPPPAKPTNASLLNAVYEWNLTAVKWGISSRL
jgi:hypothetical protein